MYSSYYGNNQKLKHNDTSSSIPIEDVELFYCLIGILLSIIKITRPNVQECISSLITTMNLPMNCYKNGNLKTDILFMKKIQIFVLSSSEDRYTHIKTLYYEYKNNILIMFQQIIQSQRFMKASTILKRVLNNMIK